MYKFKNRDKVVFCMNLGTKKEIFQKGTVKGYADEHDLQGAMLIIELDKPFITNWDCITIPENWVSKY